MINLVDYYEKLRRVRSFMEQNGYDYVMLMRRDNFGWLTCGGDSKVFRSSEYGMGILLVGRENVRFIAQYMDADRIYDDELDGLGIEKISLKWYEASPVVKAVELTNGKRTAADFDVYQTNVEQKLQKIYALHYPLTESEIALYQEYGRLCDRMLFNIASRIKPGMTEHEIEAEILYDYARENMPVKVLLVSSDERIDKYRHPLASGKKVQKRVLLHPAAEKRGLHLNITRTLYFGEAPRDVLEKQELLNLCEAQAMAMCRPGFNMTDILTERKRIFSEYGCADEWKYHYPGAVSGYQIGSAQPFVENCKIESGIPFDLFVTVKGAKVEEMCLSSDDGGINLTATGHWPLKTYRYGDREYRLPIILQM